MPELCRAGIVAPEAVPAQKSIRPWNPFAVKTDLKTAQAINLDVPPLLLAHSDEAIE